MQATIIYQITEQAQRAQMAATGQPVAIKQQVVEEVSGELLLSRLARVDPDGSVTFDLTKRWGVAETGSVNYGSGYGYGHVSGDFDALPASGVAAIEAIQQRIADYAHEMKSKYEARQAEVEERQQKEKDNKAAARDRELTIGQPLISAFISDPSARAVAIDYEPAYWVELRDLAGNVVRIAQDGVFGSHLVRQLGEEAWRRVHADKAALEEAKKQYIKSWIAEQADQDVRQQYEEGLLCRKTAVSLIASAAFAAAGVPAPVTVPDTCAMEECPCCDSPVDCLPRSAYPAWKAIKAGLPKGSTVTFAEVRECLRGEESYYTAAISMPHGPFTFTRRVRL